MNRLSYQDIISRYGPIENSKWPNESKWMVMYDFPQEIKNSVINSATGQPVKRLYCNKDIVPFLNQALKNIIAHNKQNELKTFDGCFQIRMVRGSQDKASLHSWGIALDFCAKDNPLGKVDTTFSQVVIDCFKQAGFIWGGDFTRKDNMHFEISDIILKT